MSEHATTIERLRYKLERFVDGSERTPEYLRGVASEIQDAFPGDEAIDQFLLSVAVYGDPQAAFYRTEPEMRRECLEMRRHLSHLS